MRITEEALLELAGGQAGLETKSPLLLQRISESVAPQERGKPYIGIRARTARVMENDMETMISSTCFSFEKRRDM